MIHLIKMKSRFWSWKLPRSALLSLKSCSTGAKKAALSGKHESCLYTLVTVRQGIRVPWCPHVSKNNTAEVPCWMPLRQIKKKKKWKIPEQWCIVQENLIKCSQAWIASCVFSLQRCSSYTQDWQMCVFTISCVCNVMFFTVSLIFF